MKADKLRSIQTPLKEHYREDPAAALVTLKAQGRIGEGISCKVETGTAVAVAGLHPATGGDGLSLCSGDMLLEALAACAGVTLSAVATSICVQIYEGVVLAEGDLDFRGTLGVSRDVPIGFQAVRILVTLDTTADDGVLAKLAQLTERYCVVAQSLNETARPQIVIQKTAG